ncbi:hypothetical protein DO021_03435 [Desulfobacter hydrogenophilus]|uniref:DUF5610 domain-containing protein n=2 Tax=Desulfobacter hydrogenophilus TaxID=2291 RepID=A0A328FF74_9BACT|nr:hypothetical protein [Desulfobacter hydrogenophilus]QBH15534.1 hypothetical protein EYB58_07030 [Desulfobacter hydrogenophilus]RAM03351.1 hypothetical protein DO021_03435 [Desulfobacter hydrogenophilus]
MNSVSQANPNAYGLHNRAAASNTNTASSSSELSVASYSSLDAGLTIQTREGDVVSLSTNQYSDLEAYEYSSRGVVSNEDGYAAASYNVREITLTTGETFSFTVEGDLNEEELEDIESIISGVDNIIGEMMEGDLQDAVSQAMRMGYYDSISSYEADITVTSGYAMYSEEQAATTGTLGRELAAGYLEDSDDAGNDTDDGAATRTIGNLGTSLMDQLAELLEKQQEDALARAREPLSGLFDHYLETQKAQEANEASEAQANEEAPLVDENQTDKGRADKSKPSFSDLLEMAAQAVDRTIADMVKNAFDHSLKSFI